MQIMLPLMSVLTLGVVVSAEAAETRYAHPTLYSTPTIRMSEQNCAPEAQQTFLDSKRQILATVCVRDYEECKLAGSCVIEETDGRRRTLNYLRPDPSIDRQTFYEIQADTCPYGHGFVRDTQGIGRQTCLDPYFSVAASMDSHKGGEVLFIPKLVGIALPTGETHDGYVIIRDSSAFTFDRPYDAYDFFTGMDRTWLPGTLQPNLDNPFVRLSMDNLDNTIPYRMVTGDEAESVRRNRSYPGLRPELRKGGLR